MPGLIPLMLNPVSTGSRSSIIFPADASASPVRHIRRASTQNVNKPAEVDDTQRSASPSNTDKRQSRSLPEPISSLPYSPSEWMKAVAQVKRQYVAQQYRPCSTRCAEILDNTRDSSNVEPAYMIFLNFYAGSSLEMMARPLPSSSSYRSRLLRRARDRYTCASDLIQAADEAATRSSRSSSAASSSLHSPAGSVSSRAWTNSTDVSSPNPSICSLEDAIIKYSQPTPAKKRVTFSDFPEEPIIRPDSPTLGFEDFYNYSRGCDHKYLPPLPELPEPAEEVEPAEVREVDECEDAFSFLRERSIHRYCGVLSSLRSQVTAHIAYIEAELRSAPSVAFSSGRATPDADELRNLEIKARIERLRQNGWQRRRFDARRYQALSESVLAELSS